MLVHAHLLCFLQQLLVLRWIMILECHILLILYLHLGIALSLGHGLTWCAQVETSNVDTELLSQLELGIVAHTIELLRDSRLREWLRGVTILHVDFESFVLILNYNFRVNFCDKYNVKIQFTTIYSKPSHFMIQNQINNTNTIYQTKPLLNINFLSISTS